MDSLLASLILYQDGIFDLSQRFPSISIRDQIMRAMMVADALPVWLNLRHQGDEAATKRYPVLVVGGGVAGMTIAVHLVRQGYSVEVAETREAPFGLQANCKSRLIDPTQYDWPMSHWREGCFPSKSLKTESSKLIPFQCEALASSRQAILWSNAYELFLFELEEKKIESDFRFRGQHYLWGYPTKDPASPGFFKAQLIRPPLPQEGVEPRIAHEGTYSAIVIAKGVGKERSAVKDSLFQGFDFWETDPFEDPSPGGPALPDHEVVLISGTGDGGLQDFLRIMTRGLLPKQLHSAKALHDQLKIDEWDLNMGLFHSLERQQERVSAWANERSSDYPFKTRPYHERRHQHFLREIGRVLKNPSILQNVLKAMPNRPRRVHLISETEHFECLYGLNLLLSLILIRAIQIDENQSDRSLKVWDKTRILSIRPDRWAPATPKLSARECLCKPWSVQLQGVSDPISATLIVIRHGLNPMDNTAGALPGYPKPMPPMDYHG